MQAGKQRLIDAISLGILLSDEATAKLIELREQEQRLTVELASIAEKTAIMEEWQLAVKALKSQNITETLYSLAKQKPIAFRQLLGLIFEPNSLRVRTERKKGNNVWAGVLEAYLLTEIMQDKSVYSFGNSRQRELTKDTPYFLSYLNCYNRRERQRPPTEAAFFISSDKCHLFQ